MAKPSVAIVGTRGIPNQYGGFEQFAEYFSVALAELGYDVAVYNPHYRDEKLDSYKGVRVIHKYCPERYLGAAAHILYDFLCLRDAVRRKTDVILELGYQSSALSMKLCSRKGSRLITNMDGMEWQRAKWGTAVKAFTRWAEKAAIAESDIVVADNPGIQHYIKKCYGRESAMIAYGAEIFQHPNPQMLQEYDLIIHGYYILIARLEPENNVETVLDGFVSSGSDLPFIVIGNPVSKYGQYLTNRYAGTNVRFIGAIYDQTAISNLRYYAKAYFHGHSVGGTNPSLLEAMASSVPIVAHDNVFNQSVLQNNAYYFTDSESIRRLIISGVAEGPERELYVRANLEKIKSTYSWHNIIEQYRKLIHREAL